MTPHAVDPRNEPEGEAIVCAFAGFVRATSASETYATAGQCLLIRTTPFEEGSYTCWSARTQPYDAPFDRPTKAVDATGEICVDAAQPGACGSLVTQPTPPTGFERFLNHALCVGLDAVLLPPCLDVVTSDGRQAPPSRTPVFCVS